MPSQIGTTAIASANGGSSSTAGPINTVGATLLLVSYSGGVGIGAAAINDTGGNTWHFTPNLASAACNSGFFYSFDKSGAALSTSFAHSVTVSAAPANAITFSAFSGTLPNQVNPLNTSVGITGFVETGLLSIQPGAITPPGGSLVASFCSIGNILTSGPLNISPPFTIAGSVAHQVTLNFGNAVAFSQSQDPVNPLWTYTSVSLNPNIPPAVSSGMAVFSGSPTNPIFLTRAFQLVKGNNVVDIVEMGFDFSQSNSIMVKVDSFRQLRGVKMRSVFIDLSQSDSPITITDNVSGANVLFVGRSQGWVPLMFNEPMQFSVAFNSGLQTTRILLRFSSDIIQAGPWRTG